jgi:transposase
MLLAEIGEMHRFSHPKQLMAYLGMVPGEYPSGPNRAQGSITKTGNGHARRALVESAWSYRYAAHMGTQLTRRNQCQPREVREIAWRDQLHLCARFRGLRARGVQEN